MWWVIAGLLLGVFFIICFEVVKTALFPAIVFGLFVGYALSFCIWAKLLKRSNSIGDSIGSLEEYSEGISLYARPKELKREDVNQYVDEYYRPLEPKFPEPADEEPVRKMKRAERLK